MNTYRRNLLFAATAVLLAHGMPISNALAIDVPPFYTGPDREQRLLEGAKREGQLNIYSSMTAPDLDAVTDAFQKKYGIKVNAWRAGSEKVLQRAVTEARGGRNEMDIVETNGPEMEALHREKVFTEVASPHTANLIPVAIRPHREWIAIRMQVFVQAYNTKLVSKDDLPKSLFEY